MKRLLVANRGEIAVRILCAARELSIHCVAIYCESDTSHISFADEAVAVPRPSSFLDIGHLVTLCKERRIDAVHPGYGFLSESAEFASKLRDHGISFVGPSPEILETTGSKLKAKGLAKACHVPVIPALEAGAGSWQDAEAFASEIGYPIMLKAVDGGGGRGIRLVKQRNELQAAFDHAVAESPSRTVFAEKALVEGWRHIEIQILGDGEDVRHFWERECSIQRRYQKVVEIAPSMIDDRQLLGKVIGSAVSIAKNIKYTSLGTFEFLVSPSTGEYYFMEINPRLQVEHTVTESICGLDLVQIQLMIASGRSLKDLSLAMPRPDQEPPALAAIQLRVTAEDVRRNFALSPGRINEVVLPRGNGVRVDTHVNTGTIVSTEFDSLLAKIIVHGNDFGTTTQKALRCLQDLSIAGITTNSELLRGILLSKAFTSGQCDTQWLEANLKSTIELGATKSLRPRPAASDKSQVVIPSQGAGGAASLKKGDAWSMSLTPSTNNGSQDYHVKVDRIFRNDFPNAFGAEVSVTSAAAHQAASVYTLKLEQSSASGVSGGHAVHGRKGDPSNPAHLICPLAGQLVEMLVDDGDEVDEHEAVAIIRQMKMELEVRAHRKGTVKALWDVEDGEDVDSGTLVCEIVAPPAKPKL